MYMNLQELKNNYGLSKRLYLRRNRMAEPHSWVISTPPFPTGPMLKSNIRLRDFKFPPQCNRNLRSSGMLRGVES
jgi:hypothetical protein